MTIGSLFTGSGMLDVAVQSVFGGDIAWHCEPVDTVDHKTGKRSHNYAVDLLAHHWPDTPNLGDITEVDWAAVPPVDVLCGGFPCQDVSSAGVRRGMVDGSRSGLWANMADAIAHLQPSLVVIENVRGLLSAKSTTPGLKAIDAVLNDLTLLGYGSKRIVIAAANAGAPHRRDRVFIVARQSANPVHEVLPSPKITDMILLPTPIVGDAKSTCNSTATRHVIPPTGIHAGDTLTDVIRTLELLPTPNASDGTAGKTSRSGDRIGERLLGGIAKDAVAHLLPTPRTTDSQGGGKHGDGGLDLRTVTTALPHEPGRPDWGKYTAAIARWENLFGPAPFPVEPNRNGKARLAAEFSQWMMGWPAGWVTDVVEPRTHSLKLIGNGVVPQQAAAALTLLLAPAADPFADTMLEALA